LLPFVMDISAQQAVQRSVRQIHDKSK